MQIKRLKTKTKIEGFLDFGIDKIEFSKNKDGIKCKITADNEFFTYTANITPKELIAIFDELQLLNLEANPRPKEKIPEGYCRDRRGGIRQLGTYDG